MRLEPLLLPENTLLIQGCAERDDVLRRLADHAGGRIPSVGGEGLFAALLDREKRYPTSTPEGVAFPHAMLEEIEDTLVLAAVLDPPVDFRPGEHPPIRLVFGIFGSASRPFQHVQLLARLAMIVRTEAARQRLFATGDGASLHQALIEEDRAHA